MWLHLCRTCSCRRLESWPYSILSFNTSCIADTGVTYSWDFSKAEEKEQEVRAAKAARGRARQQKAEKHSQRLHHQREKAATTLARLTALQPDASAETVEGTVNVDDDDAAAQPHHSSTSPFQNPLGKSNQEVAEQLQYQQPPEHTSSTVHCIQQASDLDQHAAGHEARQGCHMTGAYSMPAASSGGATSAMRQAFNRSNREDSEPANTGSAPLRRLASVAGYPIRQMTVPGPLLHSCAVESRRDSSSSMQSWQIVRPRPVQSEKAAVRRPSHVKVQG